VRPINLLPRHDRAAAAARRNAALAVLVGLLYLGGLAGLTMLWNGKVVAAEQRVAEQQAVNQRLQSEVASLAAADTLRAEYENNVLLTRAVLSGDVAWGRLLNDFGRLIPQRVWLDNFVGSVVAGDIPGVVGRITVAGIGFEFTDVAAWLRSLDESRFPGVAGTWVTNATETQGLDEGDTLVAFTSSAGLTQSAISNRIRTRVPEVPG